MQRREIGARRQHPVGIPGRVQCLLVEQNGHRVDGRVHLSDPGELRSHNLLARDALGSDRVCHLTRGQLDDIATSVEAAAATGEDTRTRLLNVVRAQRGAMATRPATSQLLVANLGRAGKLPDIAAGIDRAFQAPVRQILSQGMHAGEIRSVDPDPTATAIFGAVTVVGLHSLMLHGHLDVDKSLDALVVLWGGLAPTNGADPRTRRRPAPPRTEP